MVTTLSSKNITFLKRCVLWEWKHSDTLGRSVWKSPLCLPSRWLVSQAPLPPNPHAGRRRQVYESKSSSLKIVALYLSIDLCVAGQWFFFFFFLSLNRGTGFCHQLRKLWCHLFPWNRLSEKPFCCGAGRGHVRVLQLHYTYTLNWETNSWESPKIKVEISLM